MFKAYNRSTVILKLFKETSSLRIEASKLISTHRVCSAQDAVNVTKRDDYYKQLGAQNDDSTPSGWDEALPFEALPGPKPLPLIGNIWRFLPYVGEYYNLHLQQFHKKLRDNYGDIIHFKGIPGRKPVVMLYNTDDMEVVLRNAGAFPIRNGLEAFVYYRKIRKDIFKKTGGVLTVQGEEWFKIRSVVNPILMQPRVIQQYVGSMDKVANELIENIKYFSKNNKHNEMPDDFQNELYKWTLESIGVIILEKHLGCLNLKQEKGTDSQKFISHTIQMFDLMYKLEVLPPFWKIFGTPSWKKFVKTLDFITETTLRHIEEALNKNVDENRPEEEMSVLQRLAKVDKDIAIAMAMDLLIAGIDTTGKTMAAALYFLAKNPDKQECLREEARKYLPEENSPVTKEILSQSSYLKAVVKETTRIAPIAVGNLRTSIKDLVLSGYKIPKDIMRNFKLSWHHEDMVFSAKFLYGIQSPLKLRVIPLNS